MKSVTIEMGGLGKYSTHSEALPPGTQDSVLKVIIPPDQNIQFSIPYFGLDSQNVGHEVWVSATIFKTIRTVHKFSTNIPSEAIVMVPCWVECP